MALTFLNQASATDTTNFGLLGQRIYAQVWDAATNKYATSILDLGVVEDLSKSIDEQESTIDSARNGVRTPVKTLTQSFAETFTFTSLNFGDPLVAGLYEGNTALAALAPGSTTKIVIRRPGTKARARLFVLYPGAPNTDSMLLLLPKVEISSGDETVSGGTDAAKLGFSAKVLADETYKVPTGVLATNPPAPYRVRGLIEASTTPVEDLHALIEALMVNN